MQPNTTLLGMICKDEKILWAGKPNFKCFVLESIFNPLLPFALVWALFDGFFITMIFTQKEMAQNTPFPAVMFLAFFAQTFEHKKLADTPYLQIRRGLFDQWIGVGDVIFSNQDTVPSFPFNTKNNHFRGIIVSDIAQYQQVFEMAKEAKEQK